MLEAFRSLFHGSGYHPRLTLGAARTADRQKLWIGCFPHGHFSPTLETCSHDHGQECGQNTAENIKLSL
jgi:hypothetical protein